MEKQNFYKILCSYTPEELNELISKKGKQKMVNAVTFIPKEERKENNEQKADT